MGVHEVFAGEGEGEALLRVACVLAAGVALLNTHVSTAISTP